MHFALNESGCCCCRDSNTNQPLPALPARKAIDGSFLIDSCFPNRDLYLVFPSPAARMRRTDIRPTWSRRTISALPTLAQYGSGSQRPEIQPSSACQAVCGFTARALNQSGPGRAESPSRTQRRKLEAGDCATGWCGSDPTLLSMRRNQLRDAGIPGAYPADPLQTGPRSSRHAKTTSHTRRCAAHLSLRCLGVDLPGLHGDDPDAFAWLVAQRASAWEASAGQGWSGGCTAQRVFAVNYLLAFCLRATGKVVAAE